MKQEKTNGFLSLFCKGIAIGCAFILPGFSGGTVAALLGVYESMVLAVSEIFTQFKKSFSLLFPILLGMVAGICLLMFPLKWALGAYPLLTVSLFVGLSVGGIPVVAGRIEGKMRPAEVLPLLFAFALAFGLLFLPGGEDVSLSDPSMGGYLILFLVGMVGSFALVVPGISGSMLLLILGFYHPLLSMVTGIFRGEWSMVVIFVLLAVFCGMLVGFFLISNLMKFFLKKYPRPTYVAILGFILGSMPSAFFAVRVENASPLAFVFSALLLILGAALSLGLVKIAKGRGEKRDSA